MNKRELLTAGVPELPIMAFRRVGGGIKPQGGSNGSSQVTNTTKMEVSPELQAYLSPFMQHASAVAMTPYQQYGGQLVASQPGQTHHGNAISQAVSDQLINDMNNSRASLQRVMNGEFVGHNPGNIGNMGNVQAGAVANRNAWAGSVDNREIDTQSIANRNIDAGTVGNRNVQAGTNALLGMNNPYLQSAIDANMGDVSRQFNNTILNNTDAAAARAGAFGGSAWQQAQQENARQMTESLGRVGNDMRMQDYALQAQLQEADVARQLGAGQFNAQLNTGIDQYNNTLANDTARYNSTLNSGIDQFNAGLANDTARYNATLNTGIDQYNTGLANSNDQFNQQLNTGIDQYNNSLANDTNRYNTSLNAALNQFNVGLNNQAYQAERDRMMQATAAIPGMNQYGYQAAQGYYGAGQANQSQNQAELDAQYAQWLNQQNHPYQSLDVMGNAIRTLMGGGGTTTATGPNPNQSSPIGGILGGAMAGAGMGFGVPGALVGGGLGLLGGIL